MTAIDALTLSTLAKREKSHFDAQIAGIKKARQGGSYGFNENFKCIKNQAI
jgi:hypothetical protein